MSAIGTFNRFPFKGTLYNAGAMPVALPRPGYANSSATLRGDGQGVYAAVGAAKPSQAHTHATGTALGILTRTQSHAAAKSGRSNVAAVNHAEGTVKSP